MRTLVFSTPGFFCKINQASCLSLAAKMLVAIVFFLPFIAALDPPALAQEVPGKGDDRLSGQPALFLKKLSLAGNTVLSSRDIDPVLARYIGRTITSGELQQLRRELTGLYIDKGYLTSGVIIPDQPVADGEIEFKAVEGVLSSISVTGTKNFATGYFTSRIERAAKKPLNVQELRQALLLFEQDRRIKGIHASLEPGLVQGESTLDIAVEENPPFKVGFDVSNTNPPSMGEWRTMLHAVHTNLTGQGDVLSLDFGGSQQFLNNPKYFQADLSYARPLSTYDTTLKLRYARYQTAITEEPFTSLNMESNTNLYQLSLSQPVYRNDGRSFALGVTGDYRNNMTYVLDEPYSLSPGSQNGKTAECVVRLFQEYLDQGPNHVVAALSSFNFGIDALDATTTGDPNGRFFTWLGQFKTLYRLFQSDFQLFLRTDMQFTSNRLLSIEQFSVGGFNSVRGYRENRLVRDGGLSGSVELRVPILTNYHDHTLQLVPFYDFGGAYNNGLSGADGVKWISSVGAGIKWQYKEMVFLQFYKAFPFVEFKDNKQYLQDLGYHFMLGMSFTF